MHYSMLPRFGNCNAICSAFNLLIFLLACIKSEIVASLIEVLISQAPKLMPGHVWLDVQFNWAARPLICWASSVVNWASVDIFLFVSITTSGFDNYCKIAVHDHIWVPKILVYVTYVAQYQKTDIMCHTFYLVIFLTISHKLILV